MNNFKRALLATTVAAAGVTAFASSSSATPVGGTYTQINPARLENKRGDIVLGGEQFDSPGTVLWDETGDGVQATFRGRLHIRNVPGACARVRMISLDEDGIEQGDHQFFPSDEGDCAGNDGHLARDVLLAGYTRLPGVQLTLQVWASSPGAPDGGHWRNSQSVTLAYASELPPSDVLINGGRHDLGAGTLESDVPSEPGQVTWQVNGWNIKPKLSATLWVKSAQFNQIRVMARCYDADDVLLPGAEDGDLGFQEISPATNGIETFQIDREPCTDNGVAKVGVTVEAYDPNIEDFKVLGEELIIPLPTIPAPIDLELPQL